MTAKLKCCTTYYLLLLVDVQRFIVEQLQEKQQCFLKK